ncbi:restriction endonuclease subunit S [Lactiplantibacillus plantarum]|nr:restriction endonuclease subunit S [Lactiplantibacillus plantarum]
MKDNQAKYPQLRFKGFTDPWEKRSLDEITTKTKSYSLSRDVERDHETGYRYIHYGDIHTGVADASEDYQGIAEPAVVVGLPTQHLVAGLHTIALRPSSASSLYLYYLLHTESFKHFGYQTGTGLKVFGISWSNLSKFTFMIPSRPEQEKIVKLIESVDNLTSDNQRKLAKLKELKQGYLQKLFPKNGSKFPQLRFTGFADAWEERKLGDIFVYKQGQQVPVENQFTKRGKNRHRFIRIVDLTTNNEAPRYIEYSGDNIISSTDLFMIRYGQPGVIGYGYEGVIANNLFKLIPKIETYNLFFKYILDSMYPKIQSLSSSTTMPAISFKSLDVLAVRYPNKKEQEKIGSFFAQLDNTIALHQRKLEKLQELKKGYLQKMFC